MKRAGIVFCVLLITSLFTLLLYTVFAQESEPASPPTDVLLGESAAITATWTPTATPTATLENIPIPTFAPTESLPTAEILTDTPATAVSPDYPAPTATIETPTLTFETATLIPASATVEAPAVTLETPTLPVEMATLETPAPTVEMALPETLMPTLETLTPEAPTPTLETVTPEALNPVSETPTSETPMLETPTVTATPTPELVPMMGRAFYQSRLPDHSGISVTILDGTRAMLSRTVTDGLGDYTALIPPTSFYWLVAEAPLHRRFEVGVWPGDPVPEVTLAGGDLSGDGCVGPSDIVLLTAQFGMANSAADIDGDGSTDAPDLAILAGNYDLTCEATPEASTATPETATPTLELTLPDNTSTAMPEATLESTVEAPAPPTAGPSASEVPIEATIEIITGG